LLSYLATQSAPMPPVLKAADILCAAGALIDFIGESCLSMSPQPMAAAGVNAVNVFLLFMKVSSLWRVVAPQQEQ
jgi:hypothetical protein